MKLFIIRHAESANNRLGMDMGYDEYMAHRSADPPLTDLGQQQAERLGEHLNANAHPEASQERSPVQPNSGYGFTHLYCSPMLRALQTAQPVANALRLYPEVWVDIHEHGGLFRGNPRKDEKLTIYPGLTRPELSGRFSGYKLPSAVNEDGWWKSGYEDMPACYARAMRVASDLRQRAQQNAQADKEEWIAMVSHGTFIDSLLKAFFNQIPNRDLFYQHYNTAITRLDFMPDGTLFLRYLNRTQHLPPEMFSV
jgi:broad specificity phosphatase PhoE